MGCVRKSSEKVWAFGVILSELLTKRELEMLTHLKSMKIQLKTPTKFLNEKKIVFWPEEWTKKFTQSLKSGG